MSRCIARVYQDGFFTSCGCSREATLGEYCWQHDPDRQKKDREKRAAVWKREREEKDKARAAEKQRAEDLLRYEQAIIRIASGELNDPVGYAQLQLEGQND